MRATHALRGTSSRRTRVLLAVVGATLGLGILGAGVAFGYFATTDPSNPAQAVANSLPQGTTPSVSISSTSYDTVTITFTEVNTTAGGVEIPASDYLLQRYSSQGGPPVAVNASCVGTGIVTCTESSVPQGTWQYTDTPTYGANWVGTESALSAPLTVDTTPSVAIAYPVDGTTYGSDWTGTITGTASPGAGATVTDTEVAIEDTSTTMWWDSNSFASTTQVFGPVTGSTTWMVSFAADNLTSGDNYAVVAEATDSAGNVASSPTVAFTYKTPPPALPVVSVTYPIDDTAYGADWTSMLTGTAAGGTGATITSTEVAIENSTANLWWNGKAFTASSKTFVPVSGTTTWMLAMPANDLTSGDNYSVTAQATDDRANVGNSSTVAFTYDLTPAVAVTYPVAGSSYGSDWTGTITGTAAPGVGATVASTEVAIEDTSTGQWWNGTSFSDASQTFVTASGTTTWYQPLAASDLNSGDSYSVIAQSTDSAGNVGTSSTVTFSYSVQASSPTATITYPVDGTTYGSDWTGTITGTASAGAGTTINTTAVAIEDTSTAQWWNGTSFAASSQTFVPVSGTTTWMMGLGPDNLTSGDSYSVTAQATDSDNDVGTSPTVTFAYTPTASAS
jgi:hypothetical protein